MYLLCDRNVTESLRGREGIGRLGIQKILLIGQLLVDGFSVCCKSCLETSKSLFNLPLISIVQRKQHMKMQGLSIGPLP